MEMLNYKVSVVIPTKNAGPEFYYLLEKLKNQQDIRETEIVIVDSGSTDATLETARQYNCKIVEILPQEFTFSYARNRGIKISTGDFLLCTNQDALPDGPDWLYRLVRFLLDSAGQRVAAVSCMEFPRTDSDLFFNFKIYTHYNFLQCFDQDKIMEYKGEDYFSLRMNGGLSNVACMARKAVFEKYEFGKTRAEDMDFGIRLIKDGYRVAMLSSCKVIHSHNRSPFYFLKRYFAEIVFLTEVFPDFAYHKISEPAPFFSLIDVLFAMTDAISQEIATIEDNIAIGESFELVKTNIRLRKVSAVNTRLKDQELLTFLEYLSRYKSGFMNDETFIHTWLLRLAQVEDYMEKVYSSLDKYLLEEFDDLMWKLTASTVGIYLGYLYKTCKDENIHADMMEELHSRLTEGV